jgi:glutaredoxin-related protein
MTKNALISNPPFLHLKSNYMIHYSPPTPNLYNDMFFALDKNLMMNYVQYSKSRIQYNLDNVIGSEQNLCNFIRDNHIDFDTLSYFGLIRIDYKSNNEIQLI